MADQTVMAPCGAGGGARGADSLALPVSPFYAPRYSFGMLLGVDDFEAEQGYLHGKTRLHNAWLHREGVVWGFGVDLPEVDGRPGALRGEVRVHPGLALDAAGRELHLDGPVCAGLAAWYDAHRDEDEVKAAAEVARDGTVTLGAAVWARFRACAARPVPSIAEPCQDASSDVAYSRAQETVELLLLPLPKEGLKPRTYPYHRLRLLFGLEPDPAAPDDAEAAALAARAAVAAAADADRPRALLAAFRRLAALDEIGLRPATLPDGGGDSLFPADDDCRVLLATVTGIVLKPGTDGKLALDGKPLVDPTVRPSHVATSTIQELTCGGACCAAPAPAPPPPPPPPDDALFLPVDAGGPRIASAALTRAAVVMQATAKLAQHSVTPAAFSVSRFDPARGWTAMKIGSATVDAANRIMLAVGTRAAGAVVRVIARGTGPTPVLGEGLVPLAGAVGGPPGTADDGHDFVIMLPRSHP